MSSKMAGDIAFRVLPAVFLGNKMLYFPAFFRISAHRLFSSSEIPVR
jgi:hypothetical protein